MNKPMMLITSTWNRRPTFKLMPVSPDSPYNEAMFDIESKILAIVGKEKKESFHMIPKLNEFGDLQTMKIGKRNNGKDYAEERKAVETFYEYYVEDRKEIEALINLLAVNADSFDYQQYLDSAFNAQVVSAPPSQIVTV